MDLTKHSTVTFQHKCLLCHNNIMYLVAGSFNEYSFLKVFLGGSEVKASACNAGDPGSIPGSGRSPGEGNGNPLQYSCLENPMDGEAWVGYSPRGGNELDMTE